MGIAQKLLMAGGGVALLGGAALLAPGTAKPAEVQAVRPVVAEAPRPALVTPPRPPSARISPSRAEEVLLHLSAGPLPAQHDGLEWRTNLSFRLVEKEVYRREKRVVYATLEEDLRVDLSVQGGTLRQAYVTIPHGSYAPGEDIEFSSDQPEGNSVSIEGVSADVEYDWSLLVSCEQEVLVFVPFASPREVPADGISAARIFVRLERRGLGAPLPIERAKVRLANTLATDTRLSPRELEFSEGDHEKETVLVSHSPGRDTITLQGYPFAAMPATCEVYFYFPWLALAICLVGGLLGGCGDLLFLKQRKGILTRLGLGVFAALVLWFGIRHGLGSAELLGVKLIGAASTQGSFFLGLLGGFLALTALKRLRKPLEKA